ncbi:MAG: uroporphyrin-III C-methyltransferase, partial [Mucilaginibacter sp.]|nr:uroporphyrin-III C-methyltransferase [Mucilaginibacter sp.]
MSTIQIKRIYEPAEASDGTRILVDRLWPRGIKKELAKVDEWMKEVAPSTA